MVRQILVLFLLFMLPLATSALTLPDVPSLPLATDLQFLEDASTDWTVDDVRRDGQPWQPQGDSAFNRGYSASAWWLKLDLHNGSSHLESRYLALTYAVLDHVDVYVYDGNQRLKSYALGDWQPFRQRPVMNRFFVVPLDWNPQQTLTVFLRIKSSTSVQAPLALWQHAAFEEQQADSNIAHGLYYGAMVVIAIYNLLLFVALRDLNYLLYSAFVISVPLFMASLSGHAYHYLWPESPQWNDDSIIFFLGLVFASVAVFARRFLQVRTWSVKLHWALTAIAWTGGFFAVTAFAVPYSFSIRFMVPMGFLGSILFVVVGCLAWMKGIPSARYYVIAWLVYMLGSGMMALSRLNFLPTNFITEYGMQFGSALEAVLLSFALAERINVERRLRFEAQAESLRVTQRLNEDLELRVQERTEELALANARLETLSNTDQLTGLHNRRFLEAVLSAEWYRCKRHKHGFAVLMMDVDFFKQVNDRYGHAAGDECLRQVAVLAKDSVRWPSDHVARYGGEEFCIVLPETAVQDALIVAERIRRQVENNAIVTPRETFRVTISIGICAGIPCDSLTVDDVLRFADTALYQSKEGGRNRVTLHTPTAIDRASPN